MKLKLLSILFLFLSSGLFAQTQEWRHSDTLGGIFAAENIYIDGNANLYVGGPAIDSIDTFHVPSAALVFKLDSGGHYHWNQGFIYTENVEYFGMAGDNAGNSYVYGEYNDRGNFNAYLTKVDSSGNLDWMDEYDYAGYYDAYNNAMVDKNGNVLVAGTSDDRDGNQEMISIRFPSADTIAKYSDRYLDTTSFYNSYFAQTDNAGGMYNLGQAAFSVYGNSIVLLRYDSLGASKWVKIINSDVFSDEEPASTNSDSLGNIYIADNSAPQLVNSNYVPLLIKMSPTGSYIWEKLFHDTANNYNLTSSALDTFYFYIGGTINNRIYLAKLSAATGDTLWTFTYDTGSINKIILKNGAIYVTGVIQNAYGTNSFYTAKVSASGQMVWSATYNDALHNSDWAYDLVADNAGNIYVAGQSFETAGSRGSATVIKYHDNTLSKPGCQLAINSVSVTDINSCFGATSGAIFINATGGMGSVSYSIDSGLDFSAYSTFAGLAAGVHYIEVKDTANCQVLYSANPVSITQPAADTPALIFKGDTVSTGPFAKYSWYFENNVVDTTQFLVTTGKCGEIYVQVIDSNGCTFNSVSFYTVCEGINSLSDSKINFSVYPNPFGESFNVSLDDMDDKQFQITLFDIYGQKLYEDKPAGSIFSVSTATLAQGVYMLRLQVGEQFQYRQVVKAGN